MMEFQMTNEVCGNPLSLQVLDNSKQKVPVTTSNLLIQTSFW